MKSFSDYLGDATFPVVDFYRHKDYNSEKTDSFISCYTIVHNYEKIGIDVDDDGKIIDQRDVKRAADAGTPIMMIFKDVEIVIRATKTAWELRASGTARQAIIASSEKSK